MTDIIPNYVALIGLKMPYGDHVCSYFTELPEYFKLCEDFSMFYRIKKGKRTATKENLEPSYGTQYLIYSPYSKKYFYDFVHERTNMKKLFRYFNDKNLYIYKKKEELVHDDSDDNKLLLF